MKYLDQLLRNEKAEWKTLGDICKIKICKGYKELKNRKSFIEGKSTLKSYFDKWLPSKSTLLIPQNQSLSKVYYMEKPYLTDDSIFQTEIDESVVNPKFAFYYLQLENLAKYNIIRGVSNLTENTLKKIPFPIFSMSIQNKIVEILEEFDKIIGSTDDELATI